MSEGAHTPAAVVALSGLLVLSRVLVKGKTGTWTVADDADVEVDTVAAEGEGVGATAAAAVAGSEETVGAAKVVRGGDSSLSAVPFVLLCRESGNADDDMAASGMRSSAEWLADSVVTFMDNCAWGTSGLLMSRRLG